MTEIFHLSSPTGEVVRADLLAAVQSVPELGKRLEAIVESPFAAGTPAGDDLEVSPAHARFVFIIGHQSALSALDHLAAWRTLLATPELPFSTPWTLCRAAIEAAIRCRWLIEPDGAAVRVARGYAAFCEDQEQRKRFEAAAGWPSVAEGNLREVELARRREGVQRVAFEDTTSLARRYGLEVMFRMASASAHAKEWALMGADLRPGVVEGEGLAGRAFGYVGANMQNVLAVSLAATSVTRQAVEALEHYLGLEAHHDGGEQHIPGLSTSTAND